jgi:ferredoxin
MTIENLITLLICLTAGAYVGRAMYQTVKKTLAPKGSGCGGCGDGASSCSTDATPTPTSELVQLKRSTSA